MPDSSQSQGNNQDSPGGPVSTGLNTFASATGMLAALRERRISALELLELHLRQVERHNPRINALVYPAFEQARQAALSADAARARGEDKLLLGLPLTLKDCIYAAGLPSTMGAPQFAGFRPAQDGLLAARLKAAGGILMGKTNVPEGAMDWQSANPVYGRTNNPWNLERTPGGSTGGGAAALAAGFTPLEFGSDMAGSIRVPAAFCGVYGHRPSETALARSGHLPGSALPNPALLMAVQGPLARAPEDLALALEVAAGPEIGEEVAWKLALPPARHTRLADFRVAMLPVLDWVPLDGEIQAAYENLALALSQAGVRVKTVTPPGLGNLKEYHKIYRYLLQAITSLGIPAEQRQEMARQLTAAGGEDLFEEARGYNASAADYIYWLARREKYREHFRAFFKEWDILLAPLTLTPAFPHNEEPLAQRKIEVNGQAYPYMLQAVYPSLATLSGQPATAFPSGLTREGLPIGLQAIGPYLEDFTTIRFAELVAQEFGGFRTPPGFHSAAQE